MRLIHLADFSAPHGGSFIPLARSVLAAGADRGWEVEAVFPAWAEGREWFRDLDEAGVPWRLAPDLGRRGLSRWLEAMLDEADGPVLVHTHFTRYDVPAALAARRRAETFVVWHIHTVLSGAPGAWLGNLVKVGIVGRSVAVMLCPAQNICEGLRKRFGGGRDIRLLPSAIEVDRFPLASAEERAEARRELGLPESGGVVLHFGRDWRLKGGDVFLEAVKRLVEEYGRPVVALAHGGGAELEATRERLGLGSIVHTTGDLEKVETLYGAADVLIAPSRGEGMPFAVVESICCGTPVVASDLPGHRYLADEVAACTIAPRTPEGHRRGDRALPAPGTPRGRVGRGEWARMGCRQPRPAPDHETGAGDLRRRAGRPAADYRRRGWRGLGFPLVLRLKNAIKRSKWLVTAAWLGRSLVERTPLARLRKVRPYGSTHRSMSTEESLAYIDEQYDDYLELAELGPSDIAGARILEFGPGDNFGVALRFLAAGAERVVTMDAYETWRDQEQQGRIYRALLDRMTDEERARAEAAVSLDAGVTFDPERLRVIEGTGAEAADSLFDAGSFDLIVSRGVLEYVDDIDRAFRGMERLLVSGGKIAHKIDLRDHQMFSSAGHHQLTFLTVPERIYRTISARTPAPNRERYDYYLQEVGKRGWPHSMVVSRVVGETGERRPHLQLDELLAESAAVAQVEEIRPELVPKFRAKPTEVLVPTGVFLIATKPAGEAAEPVSRSEATPSSSAAGEAPG